MEVPVIALHAHMKAVTDTKFNRDGDLLFTTAKDINTSAAVWYAKTGKCLGTFQGHKTVAGCDVSQHSTMLATAGLDFQTKIWSVASGVNIGTIVTDTSASSTAFAHDDSKLLVNTLKMMNCKSAIGLYNLPYVLPYDDDDIAPATTEFNPCASFEGKDMDIRYAIWGPTNDSIYFSTTDGSVHLLDAERMQVVASNKMHEDVVNRIHFDSTYHTLISASNDCAAKLLDYRDLSVIQTYESDVPVSDAAISPIGDQVMIGGGMDAQDVTTAGGTATFEVKFYHKVHEKQLGQLRAHFGTISSLAFYPDGRGFVSGSFDGLVKLCRFDERYDDTPGMKRA